MTPRQKDPGQTYRARPAAALGAAVLAMAALAPAPRLAAQEAEARPMAHGAQMPTTGIRAELVRDVDFLENRFMALSRAMTGKYAWRPAEGVRSVGEVFMHVAGANFMIPNMAGVMMPESMRAGSREESMARLQALEGVTDEEEIRQTLEHAFRHARHAIAMTPDESLDDEAQLFGRPATKRAVLTALVTHMHEHLGQSIAYARTNGVVPPWSEGGP